MCEAVVHWLSKFYASSVTFEALWALNMLFECSPSFGKWKQSIVHVAEMLIQDNYLGDCFENPGISDEVKAMKDAERLICNTCWDLGVA